MPIFEQGYQHWTGHLAGHAWRWLAITRRGVRNAVRSRLVRLALLISWFPAVVLAFILCMWGLVERQSEYVISLKPFLTSLLGPSVVLDPRAYRTEIWTLCFDYFLWWELWLAMLVVLLVGPNLISQDLRYNAMPLYLSRPLRRSDYFAGKLGVLVALLGMTIIVPSIVAYVLGLLFSLDASIIRDTFRILFASIAYGLVIAVSAGLLMLALSSLSRNSRYVALFWLGIWIITSTVSAVLYKVDQEQRMRDSGLRRRAWYDAEFLAKEVEAAKTNWRPLISYTANLSRIEEFLLGTNASLERLSQLAPARQRGPLFVWPTFYTRYPWYWSAGVLLGIAALSLCTLNLSIKSLDRLK